MTGEMDRIHNSIVTVGGGRGFVVEAGDRLRTRYVITAAHCLPVLPTGFSIGAEYERTYRNLLGPLGPEPNITAECVFVDPVADIAVLGSADNQELPKDAAMYSALVENAKPWRVDVKGDWAEGSAGDWELAKITPAYVVSLGGDLVPCQAHHWSFGPLWLEDWVIEDEGGGQDHITTCKIEGGMSGSPILDTDKETAIGVVVTGLGPHPRLSMHLPAGLVRQLDIRPVKRSLGELE